MSNLPILRQQWINPATGLGYAGAKLYTYAPGTTTDKAVYTTVARNVAHANPVVADANGLFAEIYCTNDTTYRFILKDSSDNTIFDVDNIAPASLDGTLSTYFYETNENPNHYGASGTGGADETSYVQSAITAAVANSRSGVVDLMGRTYRCDSALSLPSGVHIKNGTLDFSACNANDCLYGAGTVGGQVLLSSNAALNATSLSVASITGVSVGKLILIQEGTGATTGELARVASASGTTINLTRPLKNAYTTAGSAAYRLITTLDNIRVSDLTIIGNASSSGTGNIVSFTACDNPRIDNCSIRSSKAGAAGVSFKLCSNGLSENNYTRSCGVALNVSDACLSITERNNNNDYCAYYATIGGNDDSRGITYNTKISDVKAEAIDIGVSVAKYSNGTKFTRCDITTSAASSTAVNIAGHKVVIDDCDIMSGSTANSEIIIDISAQAASATFYAPRIINSRLKSRAASSNGKGILLTAASATVTIEDFTVDGCDISATVTGYGIYMVTTSDVFNKVKISNNSITGGIVVDNSSAASNSCLVQFNNVKSNAIPLVLAGFDSDVIIDSNVLDGNSTASACLSLEDCDAVAYSGNILRRATTGVIVSGTTTFERVSVGQNLSSGLTNKTGIDSLNDCFLQTTSLTATEIVGNSSGDIGHANGATIITAPGAGLIAVPVAIVVDFTYATGQYGDGGGNLRAVYAGGSPCTSTVSTLTTVGAAASNISVLHPLAGLALANTAIGLNASAAMSAGAGAGTAQVRAYYKILEG